MAARRAARARAEAVTAFPAPAHDDATTITAETAPEGPTQGPEGVVTETQSADGGTDGGGAALSTGATCPLTASFTSIPSGTLVPTFTGTKLGTSFDMIGRFTAPVPCRCSGGEYRQWVRGTFTANGATVPHLLGPGVQMSPSTWQLDGNSTTANYFGRRNYQTSYTAFTDPDQATGCTYQGRDIPGISASSGTALSMNLYFLGTLIDTANASRVLASASWSVIGSGTVP